MLTNTFFYILLFLIVLCNAIVMTLLIIDLKRSPKIIQGPPGPMGPRGKDCDSCKNYEEKDI